MTNKLFAPLGLAALCTPIMAFALLQAQPDLDPLLLSTKLHFWIVSGTALAAGSELDEACVDAFIASQEVRHQHAA